MDNLSGVIGCNGAAVGTAVGFVESSVLVCDLYVLVRRIHDEVTFLLSCFTLDCCW